MSRITFIIGCFLISGSLFAGEYAADYLNFGVGARAAGMANACVTYSGSAEACFWNPAVDYQPGEIIMGTEHSEFFGGLSSFNSLFQRVSIGRSTGLTLGVLRSGVGSIPLYAANPRTSRNLSDPFDRYYLNPEGYGERQGWGKDEAWAGYLNLAHTHEFFLVLRSSLVPQNLPTRLTWGLNVKYLTEIASLDYNSNALVENYNDGVDASFTATGFSSDLGIRLRISGPVYTTHSSPHSMILGLSVLNFAGGHQSWDTADEHRDRMPLNFRLGGAWELNRPDFFLSGVRLALERETYARDINRIGAEVALENRLFLRIGGYGSGFSEVDPAFGVGLKFWRIGVDYAYSNHDLGVTHRVSLEYSH